MTLREEVARAVTRFDDPENEDHLWPHALPEADAAIAIVLEHVGKHLSAVQYDPAPYTAMKHRLGALADQAKGEG